MVDQGGKYPCDVQCAHSTVPAVHSISYSYYGRISNDKSKNLQEHIESDIFLEKQNQLFLFLRYDYTGLTKRAFELQRYLEHMTWNFSSIITLCSGIGKIFGPVNAVRWNNTLFFFHLPRLRKVLLGNFLNGA